MSKAIKDMSNREIAIKALRQLQGDDLERMILVFRRYSSEQMNELFEHSGMTRSEILAAATDKHQAIENAIKWVKAIPVP